jgi:hypothetical protein
MTDHPKHGLRGVDGRIDGRVCGSYRLVHEENGLGQNRASLVGLIVVLGMLLLAAQRYFANKRLANKRRNNDES